MSRKNRNRTPARQAPVFAALGDETRLLLLTKLADGQAHSISRLTRGSRFTRQAITKHLRVLQEVGLVRCSPSGRESLFQFDPQPFADMREYLDFVSQQWDRALGRLKALVEGE
ncbi:MAG TPA: ArsR family transcriptional regulator [Terriglobales bacterium]|nr:ArsR family transcriptional regulator [Terriglobales bacterium]